MAKIKVAIIGCGQIARNAHLGAYMASSDLCEIKYFCDIISERAKQLRDRYGSGEVVEDYHEILNDPEVTCVSVCTPNFCHAPITIDFLNAGKHVLCEKPASVNAELAAQMQKAADDNGKILNIGVCNRFKTQVNKVQQLIEQGALGEVYHVYCSFRSHRSIPGLGGPFTTKSMAGGGALIDWGVHFLDLILFCIGEPKVKTVSAETYSKLGNPMKDYTYADMWAGPPDYSGTYDVEEFVTGLVRTEGATISLNGAWAQNIGEEQKYIEFLGDKAGIKLDYGGNFVLYSTQNGMLTTTTFEYPLTDMYEEEIRDFLIKAPQGIKTKGNIDHAIITSRLMDAIYQSAEEHRELTL
ncbi:MAG: Gfo/Idh/MocA family oxidoreductase [Clostridia bacterium]|nr:Gfo/Idh/MocA family oxidoreductase [Clostridia bacterium]MDO4356200.1 Gfo/Idh/MocA family oxidoreductase [Clostridia bacterium]